MHKDNVPFGVRSFFSLFFIQCNEIRAQAVCAAGSERNRESMEKKVTPERKMELARFIREENMGNRMKLRQRESILYGKDAPLPLFERGQLSEPNALSGNIPTGETGIPEGVSGSFKYRMTLAVLLFVAYLLCDTKGSAIFSYSTDDVYQMIVADSFHLYDGGENAVMEELAELFE